MKPEVLCAQCMSPGGARFRAWLVRSLNPPGERGCVPVAPCLGLWVRGSIHKWGCMFTCGARSRNNWVRTVPGLVDGCLLFNKTD